MTNKIILWIIKIVLIFVVMILITLAKAIGTPIFIAYIIGFAIIAAIWQYTPKQQPASNDETKHNL